MNGLTSPASTALTGGTPTEGSFCWSIRRSTATISVRLKASVTQTVQRYQKGIIYDVEKSIQGNRPREVLTDVTLGTTLHKNQRRNYSNYLDEFSSN